MKLAEIITWILISQQINDKEGANSPKQQKQITVFDKNGKIDQYADLLYAIIKFRLATNTKYTCKMTTDKSKNLITINCKGESIGTQINFIKEEIIPVKRACQNEQLP